MHLEQLIPAHTADVRCVCYDTESGLLCSGSRDGYVCSFQRNAAGIFENRTVMFHGGYVTAIALVRLHGALTIVSGGAGSLVYQDVASQRFVARVDAHTQAVSHLRAYGRFLVSSSWDDSARIWDLHGNLHMPVRELGPHDHLGLWDAALVSDDMYLLTASAQGRGRIFAPDGRLHHVYKAHTAAMRQFVLVNVMQRDATLSDETHAILSDHSSGERHSTPQEIPQQKPQVPPQSSHPPPQSSHPPPHTQLKVGDNPGNISNLPLDMSPARGHFPYSDFVSVGNDGVVSLCSMRGFQVASTTTPTSLYSVDASRDWLAASGENGTVYLWPAAEGHIQLGTDPVLLELLCDDAWAVCFVGDSAVAVAASNGMLCIFSDGPAASPEVCALFALIRQPAIRVSPPFMHRADSVSLVWAGDGRSSLKCMAYEPGRGFSEVPATELFGSPSSHSPASKSTASKSTASDSTHNGDRSTDVDAPVDSP